MMRNRALSIALVFLSCTCCSYKLNKEPISYVKTFTGTAGRGATNVSACVPFGMVQLGPDTRFNWTYYLYTDTLIYGFSHLHKSGGGCSDYQDILFLPTIGFSLDADPYPDQVNSRFSHDQEFFEPGYSNISAIFSYTSLLAIMDQ